jgi:hypothetical protein
VSAITLTTDFGTSDWFVGAIKGVIHGIAPKATVIDITHAIPPGDIRAGALALMASARFFPRKTIHVAVVDPGVGGPRGAIVVQTSKAFFVGPDNGVLSWALAGEKGVAVHQLENRKYFLKQVSQTFHGRDIFAPVAAHLADGVSISRFGRKMAGFVRLDWPRPEKHPNGLVGSILHLDHFGNAITNLDESSLAHFVNKRVTVHLKGKPLCRLSEFYQQAPPGKPLALIGSSGLLEIALNGASAARKFDLKLGEPVNLRVG